MSLKVAIKIGNGQESQYTDEVSHFIKQEQKQSVSQRNTANQTNTLPFINTIE